MSDITDLLRVGEQGSAPELGAVFDRLYVEIKRIAHARLGALGPKQTLSATELVHEAFLKLVDARRLTLSNRRHFFACAASVMRQILVDRRRAASADKRGGGQQLATLDGCDAVAEPVDLLDLDRALEGVQLVNPALRELVELRFFAGLTVEEIAALREQSTRTVARDWERARSLLQAGLASDGF